MVGGRSGRRHGEAVGGIVDVGVGQRAGRGWRARRAAGAAAGLDHGAARGAGDHRGVVAAVDGDGDDLLGAVGGGDGEGVGQMAANIERLNGGVAVVQRVGPVPAAVIWKVP